jgi:hypothetical protein
VWKPALRSCIRTFGWSCAHLEWQSCSARTMTVGTTGRALHCTRPVSTGLRAGAGGRFCEANDRHPYGQQQRGVMHDALRVDRTEKLRHGV